MSSSFLIQSPCSPYSLGRLQAWESQGQAGTYGNTGIEDTQETTDTYTTAWLNPQRVLLSGESQSQGLHTV